MLYNENLSAPDPDTPVYIVFIKSPTGGVILDWAGYNEALALNALERAIKWCNKESIEHREFKAIYASCTAAEYQNGITPEQTKLL